MKYLPHMAARWRTIPGTGQVGTGPQRQMLTAVRFLVAGTHQGADWERIGRRQALVLPILNCGVCVALNGEGRQLKRVRIGLGPVAPVPFRAWETEVFLAGRLADEATFIQAAEIAASEPHPRTNPLRSSKEYRTEMVKILVRRGLDWAVAQAREHAV